MNTEENFDSHSDEHHDALSLEQVLEEGKRRGYVRRADLQAAVRHAAPLVSGVTAVRPVASTVAT